MSAFLKLFPTKQPIIGMVHLLAMPGLKGYPGFDALMEHALKEFQSLVAGGVDGVLVENDNDSPYSVLSPSETTATMTAVTKEIVARSQIPVGVEVLLNDPKASLSIALASGAQFIRTDYFVDKMSRPEYGGLMDIYPKEVMQFRKDILAEHIFVLTDVQVKHATLVEKNKPLSLSVRQAIAAGSDGVIVSGDLTGHQPLTSHLEEAMKSAGGFPVLIGSGFSSENAPTLLPLSTGAIVGSSIKESGSINIEKTKNLMSVVQAIVSTHSPGHRTDR